MKQDQNDETRLQYYCFEKVNLSRFCVTRTLLGVRLSHFGTTQKSDQRPGKF